MIKILLGAHVDRELDGVVVTSRPFPRRQPRRDRRALDMAIAPAAVLTAMAHQHEPPLDDRDLLGVLKLAGHQVQGLAALRASLAVRLVPDVELLNDGDLRLGARPVPRP